VKIKEQPAPALPRATLRRRRSRAHSAWRIARSQHTRETGCWGAPE